MADNKRRPSTLEDRYNTYGDEDGRKMLSSDERGTISELKLFARPSFNSDIAVKISQDENLAINSNDNNEFDNNDGFLKTDFEKFSREVEAKEKEKKYEEALKLLLKFENEKFVNKQFFDFDQRKWVYQKKGEFYKKMNKFIQACQEFQKLVDMDQSTENCKSSSEHYKLRKIFNKVSNDI